MDDTVKQAVLSAVRNLLSAGGAVLVTRGLLDSATSNQIIGAFMVILPLLWGVWDKYNTESKTQEREVKALNVGVAISNADVNVTPPLTKEEAQIAIQSGAKL